MAANRPIHEIHAELTGARPPAVAADEWFRRFPNGGTVFARQSSVGGETGTAGDPSKK